MFELFTGPEANAETYLSVFTTGDLAWWQVFYVDRGAWQAHCQSFAFGFYASDAEDFYSLIHSLIGPAVICQ